jgi:hypothetical protein
VPKPRPGVFRITKNIHNILQGVSHPDQRISAEEKQAIIDWITENANRYWFSEGGPLRTPEEGGADVVIVSEISHFVLFSPRSVRRIIIPLTDPNVQPYCVQAQRCAIAAAPAT